MDLNLSRRGHYVVRAALDLARAWKHGGYRKIREVSQDMDVPRNYTPRILSLLAQAGLATARAGRDGGYRLARSPEEITLLEVVEAGDRDFALDRCGVCSGPCHWPEVRALQPVLTRAADALKGVLRETSLASVVLVGQAPAAGPVRLVESRHRRRCYYLSPKDYAGSQRSDQRPRNRPSRSSDT